MHVFGDYALYYDLLYKDKDYAAETDFVLSLFRKYGNKPNTLLDLGCGTGRHAQEMAKHGIAVEGIDLSDTMLAMGNKEIAERNDLHITPILHNGDVRSFRMTKQFDAVTSLFHVMSYQNTEEDALAAMQTAWIHLKENGLFLYDFWFGACVLTVRPESRMKTMENDQIIIQRKATPSIDFCHDTVTVHYDIDLQKKNNGVHSFFSEDHHMRYWFLPELQFLAGKAGFLPVASGAWLSEDAPIDSDWAAWMLLKKRHIL